MELYRDVDDVFVNDILPVCRQLPPLEAILQYLCEQCGYAETMGIDSIKNVYKAQIDNGNTFLRPMHAVCPTVCAVFCSVR